MRSKAIVALFLIAVLLPINAMAAKDEAYGVVVNVVDGDTFDINVEKADRRVVSSIERVRLADVDSPEIATSEGLQAKDLTSAVLLNKRVFLDIDDLSGNGRDPYGRLICVAYLSGVYGQPILTPCFNRMLVDSGHAVVEDFENEFDPASWWSRSTTSIPGPLVNPDGLDLEALASKLEAYLKDLLRQPVQDVLNDLMGQGPSVNRP